MSYYTSKDNVSVAPCENSKSVAIAFGLDCFATITNNFDKPPYYINGRGIKSLNWYYNKCVDCIQKAIDSTDDKQKKDRKDFSIQRAKRQRDMWMNQAFFKIAQYVIVYCLKNDVNTIYVEDIQKMPLHANNAFVGDPIDFAEFTTKLEHMCAKQSISVIKIYNNEIYFNNFFHSERVVLNKESIAKGLSDGNTFKTNSISPINPFLSISYNVLKYGNANNLNGRFSIWKNVTKINIPLNPSPKFPVHLPKKRTFSK